MLTFRSLFIPALTLWAVLGTAASADVRGPARVVDGDTLEVAGERIRLFGIDAPERDQDCGLPGERWHCGIWAGEELTRLIGGRNVTCTGIENDRYGRLVARCRAGQGDLAEAMVLGGAALAYRQYSHDYIRSERVARSTSRGMWRDGEAGFDAPSAYRAEQRAPREGSAPPQGDCAIKGNVSDSGRVYHMPGQRDYDRTRIDPERGERWFCTEDEARAAGWRRAQR